jgi:hypothetical protein
MLNMNVGDYVSYSFPEPATAVIQKRGTIKSVNESFVILICDDKTELKVSFRNFDRLKIIKRKNLNPVST